MVETALAERQEPAELAPIEAPAPEERPDEFYIVNLSQLSDVRNISQTTLRNFIRKYPDFPILRGGSHGVPYEFDVRKVDPWLENHWAEAQASKTAEAERTAQLRLDYFGDQASADPEVARLSPREESDLMDARLKAITVSRKHGEILVKAPLEEEFGRALTGLRDELLGLVDHLARELALDRDHRNMVQTRVEHSLRAMAEKLGYVAPPAKPANGSGVNA